MITHFIPPPTIYVSTSIHSLPISHLSSPHLLSTHCPPYFPLQEQTKTFFRCRRITSGRRGGIRKMKRTLPCLPSRNGTYSTTNLCLVLNLLFITCLLSCTQGYGSGGALFQLSILHSTQGTQNLAQFQGLMFPHFITCSIKSWGHEILGMSLPRTPFLFFMYGNMHLSISLHFPPAFHL